jgi:hypothetical protein
MLESEQLGGVYLLLSHPHVRQIAHRFPFARLIFPQVSPFFQKVWLFQSDITSSYPLNSKPSSGCLCTRGCCVNIIHPWNRDLSRPSAQLSFQSAYSRSNLTAIASQEPFTSGLTSTPGRPLSIGSDGGITSHHSIGGSLCLTATWALLTSRRLFCQRAHETRGLAKTKAL